MRSEYALADGFLTVNHGSFGATPRVVLDAQDTWRARMEAQPTRFMTRELPDALRHAAGELARFIGAEGADTVFVENATVGCNAVLGSLALRGGDEVVVLDHGYGAVTKAARHAAGRAGAQVVVAAVPFPRPEDDTVVAAVVACLGPRTRLAVIDHITSPSALVLPVAAISAACREAGVPVLIDAAHSAGNVELDGPGIGADWVAGNCHKWLSAPKGCGFLWARPDRQEGLHPVTISHGYGQGFLAEFDWIGTRDCSAWLAVTAAMDFHHKLGGSALRRRNCALAAEGARLVARRLGTETGNAAGGCAMGLIRVPLEGFITEARALRFRESLLDRGTDAAVSAISGAAWMRLSAAPYNEVSDFAALAEIVSEVIAASGVALSPQVA